MHSGLILVIDLVLFSAVFWILIKVGIGNSHCKMY